MGNKKRKNENFGKLRGKIFIISGPSGAGEDAVIDGLKKKIKFNAVITTVTRKKRKGEKNGRPYYFISEKKFKKKLKQNGFIEWAYVYNAYRGCAFEEINRLLNLSRPIIWKVDWQGVRAIKKIFPQAVAIFITVPDYQILVNRLKKRGLDSSQTIKQREKFTKNWLKHKKDYDYILVNREGKLAATVEKAKEIIGKELAR